MFHWCGLRCRRCERFFVIMSVKRKRCVEPALYCDVCSCLNSINDLENDFASTKIRCLAKKSDKIVECMGQRVLDSNIINSGVNYIWDHIVCTCNRNYRGKSWGGLKEDCHVVERDQQTTKVC